MMRTLAPLLLFCGAVFAQPTLPAGTKTCSIDGSVANSVTSLPVPRAVVNLATGGDSISLLADGAGKWSEGHIPCGSLKISARRFGFLPNPLGDAPPSSLVLAADTPLGGVTIQLVPQSAISGRILDENGDPIPEAQVNLVRLGISNGVRGVQSTFSLPSNDLGEYRFAGLPAGKYIVCATGRGTLRSLAGRCYPEHPADTSASGMNVAAGYEGVVDLKMTPLAVVTVRGTVSGISEKIPVTVALFPREIPPNSSANSLELTTTVGRDGTFTLRKVPAGAYRILARSDEEDRKRSLLIPLDVRDHDIEGIHLALDPGAIISGVVKTISATGRKPDKPEFDVELQSLNGIDFGFRVVWDESKTAFTIYGVMPTDYRLKLHPPAPFYVKSVTQGNRDITASDVSIIPGRSEIEIVLSDDSGIVEGDVTDHDQPANAWVLLQGDGMLPRGIPTDDKGHFKLDTIPPGNYKIYAWADGQNIEYANPDWMRRYAKGTDISVQQSQTSAVKVERQAAPDE